MYDVFMDKKDALKIKAAMAAVGKNLSQYAKSLNISRQGIYLRLENGTLTLDDLRDIAAFVGGSLDCKLTLPDGSQISF